MGRTRDLTYSDGQRPRCLVEKFVQPGIKPGLIRACPTTGLVALGTTDDRVQVYRLNGDAIINVRPAATADSLHLITWKPSGKYILSRIRILAHSLSEIQPDRDFDLPSLIGSVCSYLLWHHIDQCFVFKIGDFA